MAADADGQGAFGQHLEAGRNVAREVMFQARTCSNSAVDFQAAAWSGDKQVPQLMVGH